MRGRPESRETITYAINLALEHQARLTFLHIMDVEFLEHATVGPVSVVYQELRNMGEFAMLILVDRAQRRGVEQVDYQIREGIIQKQLWLFATETKADTLVLGMPRTETGQPIFRVSEFDQFIENIQKETDIDIQVVGRESAK